jgi:hypothetical protein
MSCKAWVNNTDLRNPFTGYCQGVASALVFVGRNLSENLRFCTPEKSTNFQAVKVVIAFIEAHPERLHESFMALALEALNRGWPCK